MDELITLLEQYSLSTLLIIFVLFILAIFGIIEIVKKVKQLFNDYHVTKNKEEDKEKQYDDRLEQVENDIKEDREKLSNISSSIDEIRSIIEKVQEHQNRSNIATCRSAMYRLASELINKGWMSQTEYETLNDLSDVYLMAGGSNYVRPSIIQRALSLPVLTDEEIELKTYENLTKK